MNIFVLILLINVATGQVVGMATGKATSDADCQTQAQAAIARQASSIPAGVKPAVLCLNIQNLTSGDAPKKKKPADAWGQEI